MKRIKVSPSQIFYTQNMNNHQVTKTDKELARPRTVIVMDIKHAFAEMRGAIGEVERKFKYRIGGLFIELRTTFEKGKSGTREFNDYCDDRDLPFKPHGRDEWMIYYNKLQRKISSAEDIPKRFPPLRSVTHKGHVEPVYTERKIAQEYKDKINAAFKAQRRFEVEQQDCEKEDELIHQLATKIVDVGYRVLSVKLHPDKGGSHDAMRRLGAAKELLKHALTHRIVRR